MGVMYKLLRHKQAVSMDLTQARQEQRRRTITLEGNIVEQSCEEAMLELQKLDDGIYTAKHILQLCKFLAEKSKRNKHASERERERYRKEMHMDVAYANVTYAYDEELETAAVAHLLPEGISSASGCPSPASQVLTEKLTATANEQHSNGVYSGSMLPAATAACDASQLGQRKREVLLKIRRQIFERKRLRQLGHVQQRLAVWRPW